MRNLLFSPPAILVICGLVALLCNAIWRWRVNRKHERLASTYGLLRGPGESLLRQIAVVDDKIVSWLFGILLVPLPVLVAFFASSYLSDKTEYEKFSAGIVPVIIPLALVAIVLIGARLLRLLARRRDLYLGYFGERVVSEALDKLRAGGARVFHDVPVASDANIDHVVVCATGVFAIETKTRRKGRVRPGFIDGNVTFDGAQLIYPWGVDKFGLEKARRNALWLGKFAAEKLNAADVPARAILTFPGWRVEQAGRAAGSPVRVLAPAQIAAHIDSQPPALAPGQIDLVARHLEALCRDVEF